MSLDDMAALVDAQRALHTVIEVLHAGHQGGVGGLPGVRALLTGDARLEKLPWTAALECGPPGRR